MNAHAGNRTQTYTLEGCCTTVILHGQSMNNKEKTTPRGGVEPPNID